MLLNNRITEMKAELNSKKFEAPTDDFSNFFKEDLLRIESIYQYFNSGGNSF